MSNPFFERLLRDGTGDRVEITDKIFIGRACKGIDEHKCILVRDPNVSRDHAVVIWDALKLQITDISKNGTRVNGIRMSPGSTQDLNSGDIIQVGEVRIRVFLSCKDVRAGYAEDSTAILTKNAVVTHLVADVRGFSGIGQRAHSSDLFQLVRGVFENFSAIVRNHNGTIKDYIGDAVYAFWEHPGKGSAAQALLACEAAIKQMRSAKESMKPLVSGTVHEKFTLGWGITTGKVTLSHYALRPSELAIVGDSTNLAFRLSRLANKSISSEILICSKTAKLVEKDLPVVDLGSVPIRGREGEENVFGFERFLLSAPGWLARNGIQHFAQQRN